MSAQIHIFTKPGCSHCEEAKSRLKARGLAYDEHSVAEERNADAAVMLSGESTVPQIFLGRYYLGGAEDLSQLDGSDHLTNLLAHVASFDEFRLPGPDEARRGANDLPLSSQLAVSDGSRDEDPEAWPILRFYKEFFGFWPNTFLYLHHWPDAYKLFVYCHNFAAVRSGRDLLGAALMSRIGLAASKAQGCSYCQTHSVAWGVDRGAVSTKPADDTLEERFHASLERLAARASRNSVSDGVLNLVFRTGEALGLNEREIQSYVEATALVVAAFGFLNVFNDLTSVEIEGDWAKAGEAEGVEAGRHGVSASNPDNLAYDLPDGGPSLQDMLARYAAEAADPTEYLRDVVGRVPAWLSVWPEQIRPFHAQLYSGLMQTDEFLLAEMKHLIARTFALAKGSQVQADEEAAMAILAGGGSELAQLRARYCLAAALGRVDREGLFEPSEVAALKLAWLAAQIPLTTPLAWVEGALEAFNTESLVHIFAVCGLASLVQRFVAIRPFDSDRDVEQLRIDLGTPTDRLMASHPLPTVAGEWGAQ